MNQDPESQPATEPHKTKSWSKPVREDLKPFAAELKRLREEKGLGLEEFAWACDLGRSTVFYLESARLEPGLELLIKIALTLNTSVEALIPAEMRDRLRQHLTDKHKSVQTGKRKKSTKRPDSPPSL